MNIAKLRIGLIGPLPPPSGGMAGQTEQLASLLRSEGAFVQLTPTNAPIQPSWVGAIPVIRAVVRLVPYLLSLRRTAKQSDVFHIMANSGWSWHLYAAPAIWIGRLYRVPTVVNYRGGEAAAFLQKAGAQVRFTMRRCACLIVPSRFLQEIFAKHAMSAQVVPNIVDVSRFSPGLDNERDTKHLVVMRNLEALYDNQTVIQALKIIHQKIPDAHLTLAGSGPQRAMLEQTAIDLGLASFVKFAGRLDREAVVALYKRAGLAINPSLADNMPNSILEAWASGVPVVSTNVGGVPYFVQNQVTATLIPAKSPEALAASCLDLMENPEKVKARVSAGLAEIKKYTWPSVRPCLFQVYEQVIASNA